MDTLPGEHQGEPVSFLSASLVVTSLMMEDGVVETIPADVIGVVFVSSSEASQNRKKNHGTIGDCGIGRKQVAKMDIEIHPWAVQFNK